MKTMIYQQTDDFLKQPAVTLQFPDTLEADEVQIMECEKIRDEIHSILEHAAREYVMSTNIPPETAPAKQAEAEERL